MLQGTIVKMGAEGNVFTLQADDGNSYDIGLTDIRDVEVELAQDVHIAIAYIGEVLGGPAVPYRCVVSARKCIRV